MMFINSLINIFILSLIIISYKSSAQPHSTLVAPIKKDTTTSLYTIALNSDEHYVFDLTAPFSWQRCPTRHQYHTVACFTSPCIQAQFLSSPFCPSFSSSKTPCICMVAPMNPITKSCSKPAPLTSRIFTVSWTNGSKLTLNDTYLSCTSSSSIFQSLPRGVVGLASLSLSPLSLPSLFSPFLDQANRIFAICLPSSSSGSINGVVFFGNGPYNLVPRTSFDASSLLSYTPLLRNPKTSDYFIGIKALSMNGNSIPMSPFEGVKLSTVVPYTTLRSDVYKPFVEFFENAMKGYAQAKNVKPFTSCYNASAIGFSRVGLHVPRIDLEFENGKNWTIYGANSMKQVGGDVACFAFLDGGEMSEHKIVIGSFQMENNLLQFDLDQSRLGFTSSLYFEMITCSNFNFTTNV